MLPCFLITCKRLTIWLQPPAGVINAMAILPMWEGGKKASKRVSASAKSFASLLNAPPVLASSVDWVLATGHQGGAIQMWDGRRGPVKPYLRILTDNSPCR